MTIQRRSVDEIINDVADSQITRRTMLRRALYIGMSVPAVAALLAACADDDDDEAAAVPDVDDTEDDEPDEVDVPDDDDEEESDDTADETLPDDDIDDSRMGGVGRVAFYSEVPTLDVTYAGSGIVRAISQHVFELLFAFDSEYDSQPMLIESYEVDSEGLTYEFQLRTDVHFHNGDLMEADDVVASLERWSAVAGEGRATAEYIVGIEAADQETVTITLSDAFAPLVAYLTGPVGTGSIIIPAEIAEGTGDDRLAEEDIIGTGPFAFVEHLPDRHLMVERFEDYSPRSEPPDAFSGARTAYFDEVLFIAVPDAAARIAGVEAGDYHWAEEVTRDDYDRLNESDDVETIIISPYRAAGAIFNKAEGPMSDVNLRRAAQMAFDHEEIMAASFGPPDFWRVHPSLMPPESIWYTGDAGSEYFDVRDLDGARELVEQSGYDGELVRWLGPSDREDYFAVALVGVQQLQEVGINAELVSMDWGTVQERRAQPGEWEIFNSGFSFQSEPTAEPFFHATWHGWWESEAKDEIFSRYYLTAELEERRAIWEEMQLLLFDEVPVVKFGDFFSLSVMSTDLRGDNLPVSAYPIFWNTWIEQE